VVARLGRPRDLVAARALRARGAARYGYPKLADVVVLHRLAADAFRGSDDATSEERAWVRSLRRSPYALLREVAQLEGAVAPDYWDAARTKATLARGELDRAIDALEDATFASTIFGSLKDVALDEARRRRVTELACARLEAGPNPYVESTSELDPDAAAAVGFLKTLPDDEKAALATRSSAWIRAFVTETEPLAREPRATRTPEGASIERLDLAPFVIGKKINGLALGRGGSILAVVGDETAVLVDAQTGLALRRLETTWRWGYDVAFSPDGTCVASVWHGGHVDVHDVASGARRFALEEGHSGVPNGVRSVAWSRDGARLYTGGDDGRLVAWSLEGDAPSIVWTVHEPGGFHAITTFANGDVVASHVKTTGGESNWIARFDGATGAVRERVETKTSIWAIAWRDDDTVATGGEDRLVRIADARKGLGALVASDARTIEAKRTTRLAWEADALFGVTAEGESFVWRAEDAHEGRHATGHALWALAGRFVGGDGGTIDRLAVGVDETSSTTNVANGATPFAHTRKLIAIVPCSADVITVDWDGTFGRFDLAGRGSLLAALGGTPECAVLANDELFVGMRDAVRVLDVATGTVKREIADRHDDVALDANGRVLACSHRTSVVFRDAATLAPLGAPVEVGAGSVNAIAALPDGRFVVGTERGELAILASTNGAWARTWHLHAHGRDRLERGNPHADVCSLVVSRDGSRFVSAATDRTVRVWDVRDSAGPTPMLRRPLTRPTEELRRPLTRPTEELRIAEDFGLFNRLALSPDGRRLAIPTSAGLLVYALDEGNGPIADEDPRLVLREPWDGRFAGKQLTVATFVGERELVVGTEAGAVFRVSLGENVQ
jgi:WD40 repeat protein